MYDINTSRTRTVTGIMCDTGPGDSLRYLHSMCEYLDSTDSAAVVYCLPKVFARCKSLIGHFSRKAGGGITPVMAEDDAALHDALKASGSELIFHPFDTTYLEALTPPYVFRFPCMEGLAAKAVLMDRFDNGIYMQNRLSDHLVLEKKPPFESDTLLIFVRDLDRLPEMNLSSGLLSAILQSAQHYGLKPVFTGSPFPDRLRDVLNGCAVCELYPNGSWPDYYEQLRDISAFTLGVGINSGGLDMVEAAGIPLIRLCDFHWNRKGEGADFNRFLNDSITVNVRSSRESVSPEVTEERVMEAFSVMMTAMRTFGKNGGGRIINI